MSKAATKKGMSREDVFNIQREVAFHDTMMTIAKMLGEGRSYQRDIVISCELKAPVLNTASLVKEERARLRCAFDELRKASASRLQNMGVDIGDDVK